MASQGPKEAWERWPTRRTTPPGRIGGLEEIPAMQRGVQMSKGRDFMYCVTLWRVQKTYSYLEKPMWVYILFLRHCVDVEGQGCIGQCTGLFGVWGACQNASHSVSWAPPGAYPPPGPPRWWGETHTHTPCGARLPGIWAVCESSWGGCCV